MLLSLNPSLDLIAAPDQLRRYADFELWLTSQENEKLFEVIGQSGHLKFPARACATATRAICLRNPRGPLVFVCTQVTMTDHALVLCRFQQKNRHFFVAGVCDYRRAGPLFKSRSTQKEIAGDLAERVKAL